MLTVQKTIRGLAQVPRFLLALAGVQFEDVLYSDDETWKAAKAAMNSAFPNCPALEVRSKEKDLEFCFHLICLKFCFLFLDVVLFLLVWYWGCGRLWNVVFCFCFCFFFFFFFFELFFIL